LFFKSAFSYIECTYVNLISRYNKKKRSHICATSVYKLYNKKIMENDDEWPYIQDMSVSCYLKNK